jgi:tRNA dimethylallyltransferase
MPYRPKLIAVVGPTASGKTALGIELAEKFDGEIISADSRQIYRGMDIGTAKPSHAELAAAPHHLIDIKDPSEEYTVADYKHDAIAVINTIVDRKKLPLLVGGTGLYIKSVVENLDIPPVGLHPALRAEIEKEIEAKGLDAAFKRLVALDPDAEGIVDGKNPRRVVRALEVALATGQPFTAQRKKGESFLDTLEIGIMLSSEELRDRIDKRIDTMFANGFVDEARSLMKKYADGAPALNAIGYREIIDHLNGKISIDETISLTKTSTWQYAKRQMTWFKKDPAIQWIGAASEAIGLAKQFLK